MSELPDILLERLEGAHRYERYIAALCPFHADTRPSFFVYPDKYWCSACGRHGTTESLVRKLEFIHPKVVYKGKFDASNPWSIWLKKHDLNTILAAANLNLPVKYLQDRNINRSIQSELRIGFIDNWITFPIIGYHHDIIGAIARKGEGNPSPSKYIIPYDQDANMLYIPSLEYCNEQDRIFVTFGILDAVTIYAAGLAAISTTTGKKINPAAFNNLRKKLIILPDLGEEKEALKLASKLGWRGSVFQIHFPDLAKDVNDLIWKCGYHLYDVKEMLCNGQNLPKSLQA